jgi:hypothetical protein
LDKTKSKLAVRETKTKTQERLLEGRLAELLLTAEAKSLVKYKRPPCRAAADSRGQIFGEIQNE